MLLSTYAQSFSDMPTSMLLLEVEINDLMNLAQPTDLIAELEARGHAVEQEELEKELE